MKTIELKVDDIEIHELAHLTPTMTEARFKALKQSIKELGQKLPIVMYRGKCIDGRHRVKAFKELGIETIQATNENSQMSMEDIKEVILNGYEQRRHQTPTQSAIMAYREWLTGKASGEKLAQGAVAEKYGVGLKQVGRVKQLEELAGKQIIELLFQGSKINIGTEAHPNNTDSLNSLINYFSKHRELIVAQTQSTTISEDFTDEEMSSLNNTLNKLQSEYSYRMLNRLKSILTAKLNETNREDVF